MKRKLLSLFLAAAVFFSLNVQVFADEVVPADSSPPAAGESVKPAPELDAETVPEKAADEAKTDASPAPAAENPSTIEPAASADTNETASGGTAPEPDRPPLISTIDNSSEGITINLFDYSP